MAGNIEPRQRPAFETVLRTSFYMVNYRSQTQSSTSGVQTFFKGSLEQSGMAGCLRLATSEVKGHRPFHLKLKTALGFIGTSDGPLRSASISKERH